MEEIFLVTFLTFCCFSNLMCASENVPATKVFVLPIEPSMFNWTMKIGGDYSYRASLLNAPDLPNWIEYLYSKRHKCGFLYGVPPKDQKDLQVEIIGTNSKTYETRRRVIHLNVEDKQDIATHHVHLKIDNLNVDDFFDLHQMSRLLNIFKHKLWKESFFDLYFTFLMSAVSMGARLPLRPSEGEGVVVRLGSVAEFSNTLIELQEEVKPLWKLHTCPRDFKRTTVERIFRDEGFILDWCNFRLVHENLNLNKPLVNEQENLEQHKIFQELLWSRPTKNEVSRRSYTGEFAFTIIIPALIMILLVILLSFILGFQHEGVRDDSDDFFDSIFLVCEDYCRSRAKSSSEINTFQFVQNSSKIQNALQTLDSELNKNSCTQKFNSQSTQRTVTTNGVTRPTPPPYNGTMRTAVVDF